jgi:hypothetical protein
MGYGLILAGMGKGVSDAGSAYANAISKGAELQWQEQREREREERLAKRELERDDRQASRQEAADLRKEQRDRALQEVKDASALKKSEELTQRVASESVQVGKVADQMASQRSSVAFDKLAESSAQAGEQGDIALSKEQLQAVIRDNPEIGRQYRDQGLIASNLPLSRNEARMQRAEDESSAALQIGAHSSVIEAYGKKREAVLKEISEENKENRNNAINDFNSRRLDQMHRESQRRDAEGQKRQETADKNAESNSKRADASVTMANAALARANRPAGKDSLDKPATTADIQRQITAAKDDIAIELGATRTDVNAAIASVRKRAAEGNAKAKQQLETIQPYLDELAAANERMRQFKRPPAEKDDGASTKPQGAKPGSAPASGASKAPYPDGTRLTGPGGTYVVRNGKPVLEK